MLLAFGQPCRVIVLVWVLSTFQYDYVVAQLKAEGPAEEDNPSVMYYPSSDASFSGLFKPPNERTDVQLLEISDYQVGKRRGDAYYINVRKYFLSLYYLILQQKGTWETLPVLPLLTPNPLEGLGKPCSLPANPSPFPPGPDILEAFIDGQINEVFLGADATYFQRYPQPCTPPGYMPLLSCKQNRAGDYVCHCAEENALTRWTPFVYQPVLGLNNTANADKEITCIGLVGAICEGNNGSLTCGTGLNCEERNPGGPKFCAGSLGQLARGFGGGIRFQEKQLTDILSSSRDFETLADVESHLIRVSNSFGVLGKDCDPRYWDWATHALRLFIPRTNNTNTFSEQETIAFYQDLAGIGWLDEPNTNYEPSYMDIMKKRADYYDGADSCLNEFPRMSCIQKPTDPVRGLCQCSTPQNLHSPVFNYIQDGDQCLGTLGTICTTVRGSGDHNCGHGLVCESYVEDPFFDIRIPGPLAHLEIKVCQTPKTKNKRNTTEIPSTKKSGGGSLAALDLFSFLPFIFPLHVTQQLLQALC